MAGRSLSVVKTDSPAMMTIHIVQSGIAYPVDALHFVDEAGLIVYLRARGVTPGHTTEALEGLTRDGAYTIEQECIPPGQSVVEGEQTFCLTPHQDQA